MRISEASAVFPSEDQAILSIVRILASMHYRKEVTNTPMWVGGDLAKEIQLTNQT